MTVLDNITVNMFPVKITFNCNKCFKQLFTFQAPYERKNNFIVLCEFCLKEYMYSEWKLRRIERE